MTVVDLGARVLLVAVLCVAVGSKVRSRSAARQFVASLRPLVSTPIAGRVPPSALAVLVVGAEAIVVVLLVAPPTATAGLVLGTLLLGAYAAGIEVARHAGVHLTCRCFGSGTGGTLGRAAAARNIALAAIGGLALVTHGIRALPAAPAPQLLVAAVVGLISAIVVVRWDDVRFAVTASGSS